MSVYDTSDKEKAVVLYKSTGNIKEVSVTLGIPYDTIRLWSHSDWFKDRLQELAFEERTQLTKKLEVIVDKASEAVLDRLENGDMVFDQKTGEMLRKPIAAQVASQILQQGIEKQVLIQRLVREDRMVEGQEKLTDRLAQLALEFQKYSKTPKLEVLDAVYVERETGLLEGETPLRGQAPGEDQTT